ncbi:MAG: hypothetical protein PHQ35_03070 [Phycisphaerae bacterium]|nr:hypothetical protein [Phycisphaerae bacterium]MDD5380725.1 hypothetical protein [Phycisphaerae bacterium]
MSKMRYRFVVPLKKGIIFVAIIVLIILLIAVIAVSRRNSNIINFTQDPLWEQFARNKGFLSSEKTSIENYAEAISLLSVHGVNENNIRDVTDFRIDRFLELIVDGAKGDSLDIEVGPVDTDVNVNGKKYNLESFILIPKSLHSLSKSYLESDVNREQCLLLGSVCIAMGVQFCDYTDKTTQLIGLICKREGVEIIDDYAKAVKDEKLQITVRDMKQILEKEKKDIGELREKKSFFPKCFFSCPLQQKS